MRAFAWLVLTSTLALVPRAFSAAKTHREFRAEADAAYQRKDFAAAHDAYAAALELRPDSPRYLHNLAATAALTGNKKEALEILQRLAALGVVTRVAVDQDFASLQGTAEFVRILRQFATNAAPQGAAKLLAELPDQTGILEGIAWRERTGDLFLGDVHQRCVWRRDRAGNVTRFTAAEEKLLGVFGLAVDEKRGALWAATSALPEMFGYSASLQGHAALAEFDLATGQLRRALPVPADGRAHVLGDLFVAPDGTIFLTDSIAPVVWRFTPDAPGLTQLVESSEFSSLQGLTLLDRTLLVSDYANGLFTIDLDSAAVHALAPPPRATLLGLDGLVAVPGGIVGVQNGVAPQRIVQISLSPDTHAIMKVEVLAAALPNFNDLTLITRAGDHLAVIAGGGWDVFDPAKSLHPAPHGVRLFAVAPR